MKMPALKPDESVVFRLLGLSIDESGVPSFPSVLVPPTDTIRDIDGKFKNIGFVKAPVPDGTRPVFGDIWFEKNTQCVKTLSGARADDQALFEYLTICNYNASNPNRDTSREAIFEKVDQVGKELAASNKNKSDLAALQAAYSLPLADVVSILTARGFKVNNLSEEAVRLQAVDSFKAILPETAKAQPTKAPQAEVGVTAVVKEAIENGLLTYSSKERGYLLAGEMFVGVAINEQDKPAKLVKLLEDDAALFARLNEKMI